MAACMAESCMSRSPFRTLSCTAVLINEIVSFLSNHATYLLHFSCMQLRAQPRKRKKRYLDHDPVDFFLDQKIEFRAKMRSANLYLARSNTLRNLDLVILHSVSHALRAFYCELSANRGLVRFATIFRRNVFCAHREIGCTPLSHADLTRKV